MYSRKLARFGAIGAAALAIGGGAYGIVSATAGNTAATTTTTATAPFAGGGPGGGGSNARSGPAAGGAIGKVAGVTASSFTLTTAGGQQITVKKASATTYRKGSAASSASAVKKGANVLVLGTVNGTTIAASQVVVSPTGVTSESKIVPFQRGAPSAAKQVGQIPTNYTEGSGTIVSGTAAHKATTVALAAYPGGVIDRVVKLSNGEYEVHNIGVNWPHHIFVSQSFKVMGAD
jgi:hypothetical protein